MNSLSKNGLYNSVYNIINLVFPLFTSMYVSRILLPDLIGRVAFMWNIVSYFVSFAVMATPTYGIREIAKQGSNIQNRNTVFSELFVINAIATILSTGGYYLTVFLILKPNTDVFLYTCLGFQVFMNILNIDWLYQGMQDYGYIAKRNISIKLISIVAIFILVKSRDDYVIYSLISVFALTANYIWNILHVKKYIKFDFKGLNPGRHIKILAFLGFTVLLSSLYSKVDITMLGKMVSEEAVGLYSQAHRISEIAITLCISLSAVFLPQLSFAFQNDKKLFNQLVVDGYELLSFIVIPMAVGVFCLAPEVVDFLFSVAFREAELTLRIFSIQIIIKAYGNFLCYQLVIATGNEKKRLPAYIAAALGNIILNLLLIPRLLQNGAAIASVIAELLVNGIQFFAINRQLRLKLPKKPFTDAIIASGIMAVGIMTIKSAIPWLLARLVLTFVMGVTLYIVSNFVIGNKTAMLVVEYIKKKFSSNR